MITEIHITGQIFSNARLRNAIITAECSERRSMFNGYVLTFKTKKQAVKALSQGYQYLCSEMPEEKGKMHGIRYSRGYSLAYDAGIAKILTA